MNVAQFLHDEHLESLPSDYDRCALAQAHAATYVIHQDISYEYDKPVTDLRQRLVILPRRNHGDQQRIAHRFQVRTTGSSVVRHRTDRFGNSVLHVATPEVHRSIEFQGRAIITRKRKKTDSESWLAPRLTTTLLTTPDDAIKERPQRYEAARTSLISLSPSPISSIARSSTVTTSRRCVPPQPKRGESGRVCARTWLTS